MKTMNENHSFLLLNILYSIKTDLLYHHMHVDLSRNFLSRQWFFYIWCNCYSSWSYSTFILGNLLPEI